MTRLAWLVAVVLVGLGFAPPALHAQVDLYRQMQTRRAVPAVDFNLSPFVVQLPGPGDYVRAVGDYRIKMEEAALLHEEVRRARIETRKLEWHGWEWERDFIAGILNRQRLRQQQQELKFALNRPGDTHVWSAYALNQIYFELRDKHSSQLATMTSMPLPRELLDNVDHINTNYGAGGNLGLIRGGKVAWPMALRNPVYDSTRKKIDERVKAVYEGLFSIADVQQTDLAALRKLLSEVDSIRRDQFWKTTKERDHAGDSMQAQRFIRQLDDALNMLDQNPKGAVLYLRPIAGKNAVDVVRYMAENGVQFAPLTAGKGSERFYRMLYDALAELLNKIDPQAGAIPPAPR